MTTGLRLLVCASAICWLVVQPARGQALFDQFEPGSNEVSWRNTYLLALTSGHAYRGRVKDFEGDGYDEKFGHLYEPLGLEVVAYVEASEEDATGAQALVLRNSRILLVVFCGTEGHDRTAAVRDMVTDAKVWPIELDGMRLHQGFHEAIESIWESLDEVVTRELTTDRELWLTGHSLGGALANLAAFRWSEEGIAVAGVYTFASPKIGDSAFVAAFDELLGERSHQWATTLDPIPRLPEIRDGSAYERVGASHRVSAGGWVELAVDGSMTGVPNPMAHRINAYVNYLYRALPREVRATVPTPPPLCAATTLRVGQHPNNQYPLCRNKIRSIKRRRCLERGGEILEDWCLFEEAGKFRYLAQRLRAR